MILKGLNAAILMAEMELGHLYTVDLKTTSMFVSEKSTCLIEGVEVPCDRLIPNPLYRKESREERRNRELLRIEKIEEYLKENYPDNNYAELFMDSDTTKGWIEPLPCHSKKSLKCEFLHENQRFCLMNRGNSFYTCNTCCYQCFKANSNCDSSCALR